MVVTHVSLRIFYFYLCFIYKKNTTTWRITIVSHVKLTLVVFNLVSLFTILIQFSPHFFKMIQFCPLQCETKLIIKLNYNLYIHVKIIFNIFINQITPPNYSNYFFVHVYKISSVKNYK